MNIELGVLNDGNIMLVSDTPLPDIVCRVEYYRDQRLFMLVYDAKENNDELMHYEIPERMTKPVENTPNIMIYSLFPNHEPIGYKVPLVQIGNMF
ncbi:MAG: hypothetical protein COA45_10565 [Zetaproteobacteria bacterium]|nr:MAG: hypothetical protein COA45_10565 [Zetaproteobacteria bacterium]